VVSLDETQDNQSVRDSEVRKIEVMIGRIIGFWYLERFSRNGIAMRITGMESRDKMPRNLLGKIRSKCRVGKKYHSGRISYGVAKGFAGEPKLRGSVIARPSIQESRPKMTTGKM
jgi:hypothetical protein